jgi:N-methylhydantoinase A
MTDTGTARWAIGVDMGGTFVDAVAVADDGRLVSLKHPRAAGPLAGPVLAAIDRLCAEHGIAPPQVARIVHGSTVVTNLLLELNAPPVAVLTTTGMADVLALGRQSRRALYLPVIARPTPDECLFPAHLRFEIGGRIDAQGQETAPLQLDDFETIVNRIAQSGVRAAAVCLLFAHRNPAHEQQLRERLAARLPGLMVSLSSEVDPQPREFERFFSTALDAYAKPLVADYLLELARALTARCLPEPFLMRSEGGTGAWRALAARPVGLAMSGPCAALEGVAASLGGRAGAATVVLAIDVGGTSTDIGIVEQGRPAFGEWMQVGELSLRLRCADVESLAVGGGSVVRVLAGGALRLGPRSQGAWPGPAAYGQGGEQATLTDALCVLGRLPARLAGGVLLDLTAAAAALQRDAATPLGISLQDAAQAVVHTAAAAMAEALKNRSFQRGLDPADSLLVAAGGGGAQHAAEVADLAGITQVRVLPQSGVIAALGLLCAAPTQTLELAMDRPLDEGTLQALRRQADEQAFEWVDGSAALPGTPGDGTRIHWSLALCHAGQESAIELPWLPGSDTVESLLQRFEQRHAQLRGHLPVRQALQLRQLRTVFEAALPLPAPYTGHGAPARVDAGAEVAAELAEELAEEGAPEVAGESVAAGAAADPWAGLAPCGQGPAALFAPLTTVWVPAGWRWQRLADQSCLLERGEPGEAHEPVEARPA